MSRRDDVLDAAADSLAMFATNYICDPLIWPAFAAWCNQQDGVMIPEDLRAVDAVRAILVQRSTASILRALT